jgi:hypothetical protein
LRGPFLRGTARAKEVTLRGGVKRLSMAYMVAIWLRGLVLRRQITDRKYRIPARFASSSH